MSSKRDLIFWSIFVVCFAFCISFGSKIGCDNCKHRREKRVMAYGECVEKSKDVRECRDIMYRKNEVND